MATGLVGEPGVPAFPGAADFKGDRSCHSSQFLGLKPNSKGLKLWVAPLVVGNYYEGFQSKKIGNHYSTTVPDKFIFRTADGTYSVLIFMK
ncbi:unnamed protein product, partial [Tuber aestivum]